jgi:hypothetical protein
MNAVVTPPADASRGLLVRMPGSARAHLSTEKSVLCFQPTLMFR